MRKTAALYFRTPDSLFLKICRTSFQVVCPKEQSGTAAYGFPVPEDLAAFGLRSIH
ncbi:Uncharacterized protein dnm_091790 [Desulfonema magnum]|uniref:Uncharacterized protein n=1 Tax=Desulfonema magnum TaxID=45655 RepID=A0A975BXE2_9BACT|nr:Uncharacterized protein dnm_091790 [Desulfonema magnum]